MIYFEGSCEKHGLSFFTLKELRSGEELPNEVRCGGAKRSGTCFRELRSEYRDINKGYNEGEMKGAIYMKDIREYIDTVNSMNKIALNWEYAEGGNHEAEIQEMQQRREKMFNELVNKYGLDLVLQEIMG